MLELSGREGTGYSTGQLGCESDHGRGGRNHARVAHIYPPCVENSHHDLCVEMGCGGVESLCEVGARRHAQSAS